MSEKPSRASSPSIFPRSSLVPGTDDTGKIKTLAGLAEEVTPSGTDFESIKTEAELALELREELELILMDHPELSEEAGRLNGEGYDISQIVIKLRKTIYDRRRRPQAGHTVPARPGLRKAGERRHNRNITSSKPVPAIPKHHPPQ